MKTFSNIQFLCSCYEEKHFPNNSDMYEIAIVGRSNVGKSSLINHFFQNKTLAKTSSVPGKTVSINFFHSNDIFFIDFPGYGYAKGTKSNKYQWSILIDRYLEKRQSLDLFLVLLDIRHMPSKDDLLFLEWIFSKKFSFLLIFTKTDKFKNSNLLKQQTQKILNALYQHFGHKNFSHIHYSIKTKDGRQSLQKMLLNHYQEAKNGIN